MLHSIVEFIVTVVGQWGYTGIVILMALESSFVPFPSEVIMIPAGYLSSLGKMNAFVAIVMGILGSWVGALVNYYLALFLGRPALLKWGKYIFISEENFTKAETFFRRHGEIGTFTGRLIPLVRQYVSLPAGLARMKIGHFLFYTGLGAGIWVTILVWVGYIAGRNERLVRTYSRQATVLLLIGCFFVLAVYVLLYRRNHKKRSTH